MIVDYRTKTLPYMGSKNTPIAYEDFVTENFPDLDSKDRNDCLKQFKQYVRDNNLFDYFVRGFVKGKGHLKHAQPYRDDFGVMRTPVEEKHPRPIPRSRSIVITNIDQEIRDVINDNIKPLTKASRGAQDSAGKMISMALKKLGESKAETRFAKKEAEAGERIIAANEKTIATGDRAIAMLEDAFKRLADTMQSLRVQPGGQS